MDSRREHVYDNESVRLLIYTHPFAPMVGGIETYTMLLARRLSEVAQADMEPVEVTVVTQAHVRDMDDSVLPFRVVRKPGLAQLAGLVRKADVIHVASPAFVPMLLAWVLRKPVVVEHDGYNSACPNGLLFYEPTKTDCPGHFLARNYKECLRCNRENLGSWGSFRLFLLTFPRRWLCLRMTVHIGPSNHVARRVEMPRTQIVYHGIACPTGATQIEYKVDSPVCFAYVGRMVLAKGVPVLLRAAERLQKLGYEFRLKLIGDGPVRADLERMTDELGLRSRTTFTGFLQGDALDEAMRETTAAVMPSIWQDVAPLASIEHMMNGRLLIASDIGGLGELVDGVGLKFPAGDDEALADCLRRVLEEPRLARELGNSARERARLLFTLDRMAKDHLQVYAAIAPRKARGRA
jgi:glycosyltransferase involved in cell wall biosynthesis